MSSRSELKPINQRCPNDDPFARMLRLVNVRGLRVCWASVGLEAEAKGGGGGQFAIVKGSPIAILGSSVGDPN